MMLAPRAGNPAVRLDGKVILQLKRMLVQHPSGSHLAGKVQVLRLGTLAGAVLLQLEMRQVLLLGLGTLAGAVPLLLKLM